ncbi:MAG: hypothetical protein RR324_02350 [Cellulosilyticaceae bacterium]
MSFSNTPIYSQEDAFCEILYIPHYKPELDRLLDIVILPDIVDYTSIPTPQGLSFEGERLTGLKISCRINFKIKISYLSTQLEQSIHSVHYDHLRTISFNVPVESSAPHLLSLIECGQLTLSPFITSIYTKPIDCCSIYTYIQLLVHAFIY